LRQAARLSQGGIWVEMLVIHNSFGPLSRVWVSALFKIKDFALLWVGGLRSLVVLFPLTPIAPVPR